MRFRVVSVCLVLLMLLTGWQARPATNGLALQPVARGLVNPLFVTHAGDGSGRLFILEKPGRIRILKGTQLVPEPFLDLRGKVNALDLEQGLLGLAFYPDYARSGRFLVHYTGPSNEVVVARFRLLPDNPDRADLASEEVLLRVPKPFTNHNGGSVKFGPDGYAYVSIGDGGGAGDPQNNGQNLESLLGKVLRLDVRETGPYRIPPDNPFVRRVGRDEIWAYGLRNPWQISFDRSTGDLYIADAGQDRWEEVNFQPAGSRGGENYGWRVYEGRAPFAPGNVPGAVFPTAVYGRDKGCVVVGGTVYRGRRLPALQGSYLYGDHCSGRIWRLHRTPQGWNATELLNTGIRLSSLGEDERGEVYAVGHAGTVYRLVPAQR